MRTQGLGGGRIFVISGVDDKHKLDEDDKKEDEEDGEKMKKVVNKHGRNGAMLLQVLRAVQCWVHMKRSTV